jgi:hypothetical protein
MTTFGAISFTVLVLGFMVCGWFCVFRTNVLVAWGRKNYEKSKLVQAYPFSNLVLKPWYPTYIRCAGIFIWLWALGLVYLVIFRNFR